MTVFDASVVIHYLLGTGEEQERAAYALQVASTVDAPTLLVGEVLGRISGRTKKRGPTQLTPEEALRVLDAFTALAIRFHPPVLEQGRRLLVLGNNLSIADALYVVLAEQLDTTLYTFDRKLIDGAEQLGLGKLVGEPPPMII